MRLTELASLIHLVHPQQLLTDSKYTWHNVRNGFMNDLIKFSPYNTYHVHVHSLWRYSHATMVYFLHAPEVLSDRCSCFQLWVSKRSHDLIATIWWIATPETTLSSVDLFRFNKLNVACVYISNVCVGRYQSTVHAARHLKSYKLGIGHGANAMEPMLDLLGQCYCCSNSGSLWVMGTYSTWQAILFSTCTCFVPNHLSGTYRLPDPRMT